MAIDNGRKISQLTAEEKAEAFKTIVRDWGKKSSIQIGQDLNLKVYMVCAMVAKLRKAGIPLPKMSRATVLTPDLIAECKTIFNQR